MGPCSVQTFGRRQHSGRKHGHVSLPTFHVGAGRSGRDRRRSRPGAPGPCRSRGLREAAARPDRHGRRVGKGRPPADVSSALYGRARAAAARGLPRGRGDLPGRRLHRLVHDDRHGRLELDQLARARGRPANGGDPCRYAGSPARSGRRGAHAASRAAIASRADGISRAGSTTRPG
jgi:hypothetical protein